MAYTPTNWVDQLNSGNSYTITDNGDGTKAIAYAGTVVRQGTPMSAENFNHMEQGIALAVETADEAATAAEENLEEAKSYTDSKISELIDGAPETLDTLKELADAYDSAEDLITALQSMIDSMPKKIVSRCPALTSIGGKCYWIIPRPFPTVSPGEMIIQVHNGDHDVIACNIDLYEQNSGSIVITVSSESDISAGSYYAVIIG